MALCAAERRLSVVVWIILTMVAGVTAHAKTPTSPLDRAEDPRRRRSAQEVPQVTEWVRLAEPATGHQAIKDDVLLVLLLHQVYDSENLFESWIFAPPIRGCSYACGIQSR